jgi:hypothetical protein
MAIRRKLWRQKFREATYGMKKLDKRMMRMKKSYGDVSSLINTLLKK